MAYDFYIRPYRDSDADAVRWLHNRTPADGQVAVEPQGWDEDLDDVPANYAAFWVAIERHPEQGECLVGMAGVEDVGLTPPLHHPVPPDGIDVRPRTARLHTVRVAPERQRRGIGRALVDEALCWARDRDFAQVILETTPQQKGAVALYEACGFKLVAESTFARWQLAWFWIGLDGG